MNTREDKGSKESLFFLKNQSRKGNHYVFSNIIPACKEDENEKNHWLLHTVIKRYTFDTTTHLRFLNELLREQKIKEAKEYVIALFRRAWWFKTQNHVADKMVVLGGGYSIDGFIHALALACLMFTRDFFHKSTDLKIQESGECSFSEYETEIAELFV